MTNNLEAIFHFAHHQLKPRTPVPEIRVEFFPFVGLNHTARLNHGTLRIRVSDIFADAPREIYESLALILLAKLYRRKIDAVHHHTYRRFILQADIQERVLNTRCSRSRRIFTTSSRGRHIDLAEVFDHLNERFFEKSLTRPRLSWSAKRSRHTLGRYDSVHHAIFISRIFDSASAPQYALEYVLFHEMLHIKHETRVNNARLLVHTEEFKSEERTFPFYEEAKHWLRGI